MAVDKGKSVLFAFIDHWIRSTINVLSAFTVDLVLRPSRSLNPILSLGKQPVDEAVKANDNGTASDFFEVCGEPRVGVETPERAPPQLDLASSVCRRRMILATLAAMFSPSQMLPRLWVNWASA